MSSPQDFVDRYEEKQIQQSLLLGRMEKAVLEGAGRDAPTEENSAGGKQSAIPYRFDLIDGSALAAMANVLHEGAIKYGENNWRLIPVQDHLNHLLMHTFAYLSGDTQDDHLSHILCRATFALGVELETMRSNSSG